MAETHHSYGAHLMSESFILLPLLCSWNYFIYQRDGLKSYETFLEFAKICFSRMETFLAEFDKDIFICNFLGTGLIDHSVDLLDNFRLIFLLFFEKIWLCSDV